MKIQSSYRVILVSAITLTLFVLVVVLSITARSVGASIGSASSVGNNDVPSSPSAVTRRFLSQSTAAYNGIVAPANQVYVPWMDGGTSVLRVYNVGDSSAIVQAAFGYTDTGTFIELAGGAVGEIQAIGVPTGTPTSAILSATQPIAVVVNDFGLDGRQAASYAAMGAGLGQRRLVLPDIFSQGGGGWDSQIVVQNVGVATTSITIIYTATKDAATNNWPQAFPDLAPGQAHLFDPSQAGVPEDFVGVATVQANQPIVAIVRNAATELGQAFPRHVYIYRVPLPTSEGEGDPTLFFPLLINAFADWHKSEIQFVNAAPTAASFDLAVFGELPTPISVGPWGGYSDRQNDDGRDPDWINSARVQDAPSIHSLVWLEGAFIGDSLAAYTTPRVGAQTWYLPYADQGESFATFVAVQNLSNVTVNVTLTLHNVTGTLDIDVESIPPSDAAYYFSGNSLSFDFVGAAKVQADQPVAVVAAVAGRLVLDNELFLPLVQK